MRRSRQGESDPPVITRVSAPPSNPNLRRIWVGRRVVATLPEAEVESLGLEAGASWTGALAARVAEIVARNAVRREAMAAISRRMMSRGQLEQRLRRRGHDVRLIQRVVDELAADRWIDDDAYASALAEEVVRRTPASHALLVAKLESRLIEPALAERVAKQVLTGADSLQAALKLAHQRLRLMPSVGPQIKARRLAAALARRGFDEQTIESTLQRLRLDRSTE